MDRLDLIGFCFHRRIWMTATAHGSDLCPFGFLDDLHFTV